MMKAVTGHKGGNAFTTHVVGFEVHSSLQHIGVSAIHEAAKLIEWANQMNIQNELLDRSEATSMFTPLGQLFMLVQLREALQIILPLKIVTL